MRPAIEIGPPILGAPYRDHGSNPDGWSCWGCVAWIRTNLFGEPTLSYDEEYGPGDARDPDTVARLIAERSDGWREVAPQPGAVVKLTIFKRPAHVGVLINAREFAHCLEGSATTVERLDGGRWEGRVAGVFDDG